MAGLEGLGVCRLCGNLAEGEVCPICQDETRDPTLLAVVETVADLYAWSEAGSLRGGTTSWAGP